MGRILSLPEWASFRGPADAPTRNGFSLIIDVNAAEMYEDFFNEFRACYAARTPEEWTEVDGGERKLKSEWATALEDLNSETPSAYWCEIAYQCMKMELQLSCRTYALNINVHDMTKAHAQRSRPTKRAVSRAIGGLGGGKEARIHFKNLRGFIPGG